MPCALCPVLGLVPVEFRDCGGDRSPSAGRSIRKVNLLILQGGREGFPEEETGKQRANISLSIHWARGSRGEEADK